MIDGYNLYNQYTMVLFIVIYITSNVQQGLRGAAYENSAQCRTCSAT